MVPVACRQTWIPPALGAGRQLLAHLASRQSVAVNRRLRLTLASSGPEQVDGAAFAPSAPELKFFRPAWTVLAPISLQIRFGRQSIYQQSSVVYNASHPVVAVGRQGGAANGFGPILEEKTPPMLPVARGAVPSLSGPAEGSVGASMAPLTLATPWRPASVAKPVNLLSPQRTDHRALPVPSSTKQGYPQDSSGGRRAAPPQSQAPGATAGDGRLVFAHRGPEFRVAAAAAPIRQAAPMAPSALVDALFEQARHNRGLAGMDMRLLPAAPAEQAKPEQSVAAGQMHAAADTSAPQTPSLPARLSRADIGQVAEQVARVLKQQARLERERGGGY
ncbi:hypothetical protein [Dechloromonas denitrificans]|uniref:hypothetical protein n=1 Tax=Dechloromonas denitrificans TaxID=281362 RepID=UPI001CFB62FD|nr:hypothetical protein [Dechloromonas denitrificans]UCV06060.1 hypothetical protein KI615_11445 [Dechloromonas denitrificans]